MLVGTCDLLAHDAQQVGKNEKRFL